MAAWAYILECSDGSYYVGSTRDLARRLAQHQAGCGAGYTAARRPLSLVFCQEFDRIDDAFSLEKQVKGWSRTKKLALIEGEAARLPELSRPTHALRQAQDAPVLASSDEATSP